MTPAETNKQSGEAPSAHQRLNVFLGRWETAGHQSEGLVGAAAHITALETYEWLTGELFLVHRFEGHVGESAAACIEIIGYDFASRSYPVQTFYNNGLRHEWQSSESEGVWTLTGKWQMAGQPTEVRCTMFFSDDGNTMTGKWEYLNDQSNWQTFWDVKSTKVK